MATKKSAAEKPAKVPKATTPVPPVIATAGESNADSANDRADHAKTPAKSAAKATKKSAAEKPVYLVQTEFRDRNDYNKIYAIGEDVSHFETERLEHLVATDMVGIDFPASAEDDND